MTFPVYSIRDVHVSFGALLIENNEDSAKRNFAFSISKGLQDFARSDYSLYQVGEFDMDSGVLTPLPVPKLIISGMDAFNLYSR